MSEIANTEWNTIGETPSENEKNHLPDTTPKKIVGIYGLRNKINGKWYVGQSVDVIDRWKGYSKYDCKKQRKLYNALLKYGYDSFEKVIIEECEEIIWIMDYREMYWIRNMRTMGEGYNLTEGGAGGKKSKETREKMSAWQIGKKHSEETKRKIGLKSVGRKFSMEARKKMGAGNRGKKITFSDEHRTKISAGRMGIVSPFLGKHHTPEVRKQIGDRFRGKIFTDEQKLKISLATRGIPKSEETCKKMSLAQTGTKKSIETREKIRKKQLEYWKNKKTLVETNTLSVSPSHNEIRADDLLSSPSTPRS